LTFHHPPFTIHDLPNKLPAADQLTIRQPDYIGAMGQTLQGQPDYMVPGIKSNGPLLHYSAI
jgi:hypothetical protein